MEYRKRVELDANTPYWFVELGELTRLNGGSSWPFPSYEAARKFAVGEKRRAKQFHGVDRAVAIKFPDGKMEEINEG